MPPTLRWVILIAPRTLFAANLPFHYRHSVESSSRSRSYLKHQDRPHLLMYHGTRPHMTHGTRPHMTHGTRPHMTHKTNTSFGVEMNRESVFIAQIVSDEDGSLKIKRIEEFTDSKAELEHVQALAAARSEK